MVANGVGDCLSAGGQRGNQKFFMFSLFCACLYDVEAVNYYRPYFM